MAIFENQAITEYTTRLVNERFVDPDILLTNVRQDHNDTLGKTRTDIARSLARAVPEGTHVVNGEQHPVLHEYMRKEVERHGDTIGQVAAPDQAGEPVVLMGNTVDEFMRDIETTITERAAAAEHAATHQFPNDR